MDYQIELRHLHYFKVLAEELHFRKAAERLFISQPGLSRQIKQMEDIYGIALFERGKRFVQLTYAGEFLKQEADQLFQQLTHIKDQLGYIADGRLTTLKLGFIGSAVQTILPELLVMLKNKEPLIEVTLQELGNDIQLELLQKNLLDFGFVRINEAPAGICAQPILSEHFALVVPKSLGIPLDKPVDLNDFKMHPFILFAKEYSSSYYELVMSIFQDHDFVPHVALRTVNALSIFNLVSQGLGIAIVPSSLKKGYHADVDFLELDHIRQRTTLSLVWNEKNRNPGIPALLQIIDNMHEL